VYSARLGELDIGSKFRVGEDERRWAGRGCWGMSAMLAFSEDEELSGIIGSAFDTGLNNVVELESDERRIARMLGLAYTSRGLGKCLLRAGSDGPLIIEYWLARKAPIRGSENAVCPIRQPPLPTLTSIPNPSPVYHLIIDNSE
jgi:hypothetical protein